MFVTFIGAPCSGKTTTAARVFASLKEADHAVEFLPEYARRYISRLRGSFPGLKALDDLHQGDIFHEQWSQERDFDSDSKVTVIADSCAVSALLYMSPDARWAYLSSAQAAAAAYDLVLVCHPVQPGSGYDPNRLHSFNESLQLHEQVLPVLNFVGVDPSKIRFLSGEPRFRHQEAMQHILQAYQDSLK